MFIFVILKPNTNSQTGYVLKVKNHLRYLYNNLYWLVVPRIYISGENAVVMFEMLVSY